MFRRCDPVPRARGHGTANTRAFRVSLLQITEGMIKLHLLTCFLPQVGYGPGFVTAALTDNKLLRSCLFSDIVFDQSKSRTVHGTGCALQPS